MIGCPVSLWCSEACRSGEESQQARCPHSRHSRSCTGWVPAATHSRQVSLPGAGSGCGSASVCVHCFMIARLRRARGMPRGFVGRAGDRAEKEGGQKTMDVLPLLLLVAGSAAVAGAARRTPVPAPLLIVAATIRNQIELQNISRTNVCASPVQLHFQEACDVLSNNIDARDLDRT